MSSAPPGVRSPHPVERCRYSGIGLGSVGPPARAHAPDRAGARATLGGRSARWLYNCALYLVTPLLLARLLLRGLTRDRGYLERVRERLGWIPAPPPGRCVWVHAVSVGEVRVALPLLQRIAAELPDHRLIVTTTTPSGARELARQLPEGVAQGWLPFDLPGATRRFVRRLAPDAGVLIETEIWPNLCTACHRAGVPLLAANSRLSAASARRYARVAPLIRAALGELRLACARDQATARRLRRLRPDLPIQVTGDMRFDAGPGREDAATGAALRRQLGRARPVWIAGSTHPGEEERILAAHARLRERHPDAALILVPRHPRRGSGVARLCRRHGFVPVRRSIDAQAVESTAVLLGDVLGELPALYVAADVAFVGGSLGGGGGHNPVEPAVLGLPVLVGPTRRHFESTYRALLDCGGALEVGGESELARTVAELLDDVDQRRRRGAAAAAASAGLGGAAGRNAALVRQRVDAAERSATADLHVAQGA